MSFNLVVCGAMDHKQGYIFSDFMGYYMTLKEGGIDGDFVSCFPIEQHFMWLENDHNPPTDTIKFGKAGSIGEKAIYTYSRHAYLNRQYWFTQVEAHELLARVTSWIEKTKAQAEDGNIVNIFLECHGADDDNYSIGDRKVHQYVFRDLLAGIGDGVQVNATSRVPNFSAFGNAIRSSNQRNRYDAACPADSLAYSTTLLISNRIHNSRCPCAFFQLLAKINPAGVQRSRDSWKIYDHETFMKEQLTRVLSPGCIATDPQSYTSSPVDGMAAVEMIFRDKLDVVYDPKVCSRRRRIEWPSGDPAVRDILFSSTSDNDTSVTDLAPKLENNRLR